VIKMGRDENDDEYEELAPKIQKVGKVCTI
jgi:hypothetical protein